MGAHTTTASDRDSLPLDAAGQRVQCDQCRAAVVALSVLTPLYDEHGAAIALAASSALASSFWVYAYYHSRDHKKLEPDAVTPGSDEG